MARTGRPKVELVLTEDEREQLTRWSRRAKSSQALALRSRIVLACADGVDNKTVAARVGCAAGTVGKWRARFVELRLDGLLDEPRPGRPPVIGVDQVEDVVVATLESTPANATHWSRAKMADRSSTSTSRSGRPSSPATSASRSPASTPRWPPRRPRPGPRRSRAGDPGAAHPGARPGGARRTGPATCPPWRPHIPPGRRPSCCPRRPRTPARSGSATPTPATTSPAATTGSAAHAHPRSTPTRPSDVQFSPYQSL